MDPVTTKRKDWNDSPVSWKTIELLEVAIDGKDRFETRGLGFPKNLDCVLIVMAAKVAKRLFNQNELGHTRKGFRAALLDSKICCHVLVAGTG